MKKKQILSRASLAVFTPLILLFVFACLQLFANLRFSSLRDQIQKNRDFYFGQNLPSLKADLLALQRVGSVLLHRPQTLLDKKDAGTFFNRLLHWNTAEPGWELKAALTVPHSYALRLKNKDYNFYQLDPASAKDLLAGSSSQDKLDFSWFKELSNYNYWDLEKISPQSGSEVFMLGSFAGPRLEDLRMWADLRLADAIARKDLTAVKEVYQLLRLMYSCELLTSDLEALAMLEKVIFVVDHYFPQQRSQIAGMENLSQLDARLGRRFLNEFVPRLMFSPLKYVNALFTFSTAKNLNCSLLHVSGSVFLLNPFRPWWTERTLRDFLQALAASTCRISNLREALAQTRMGTNTEALDKNHRWTFESVRRYTQRITALSSGDQFLFRILFAQRWLPFIGEWANQRVSYLIHGWGFMVPDRYQDDYQDFFDWYLLQMVKLNNLAEARRALIVGANPHASESEQGPTALQLAKKQKHTAMENLLLESGAQE